MNSLIYNIDQGTGSNVQLSSDSGSAFKLGWIVYCPEIDLEINPSIKVDSISFKDSQSLNYFNNLPDSRELLTLSIELAKDFVILDEKVSLNLSFINSDTLYLSADNSSKNIYVYDSSVFIFAPGFSYSFWNKKNQSAKAFSKIGLVKSTSDSIDSGFLFNLGVSYYHKLSRKMSLDFKVLYESLTQSGNGLDNSSKKLGVESGIVFRF